MSDKLARHLQLRTPILWVNTDEALRVIDATAHISDRPVFRMDAMDGLLTWNGSRWVLVLVEGMDDDGNEIMVPIDSFNDGMKYALAAKGIMIIENAHLMVKPLMGFLNHISEQWYRGFQEDDLDKMPPSMILISHNNEIPDEFKRIAIRYDHPLPTEQELDVIVKQMIKMGELPHLNTSDRKKITRAAVGMSEFEFLHTASDSLADHGEINAEAVNAAKLAILAKDGLLTMRIPKTTMDQIGGMDHAKHILERTTWIWQHPEEAKELEIEPLRKILLVGVPGTGKSALCEATSSALGLELAKFGVGKMMNKFIGESENNMRRAFEQIEAMRPLCLWVDELGRDFSGGQSSGSVDGGTTDRVHGEMLTGLQDLPEDVFLVCAANRIEDLPPEMLRAGRFDKILFVGFPTAAERLEIFNIHLGNKALDYDIEALAMATPHFTGAEIQGLIKEARFEISGSEHRPPTTEEIIATAQQMKGLIWNNHRDAIIKMYKQALVDWDWASTGQLAEAQIQYSKKPQNTPSERGIPSLAGGGNVFKN